jgi:hypothetical protein
MFEKKLFEVKARNGQPPRALENRLVECALPLVPFTHCAQA